MPKVAEPEIGVAGFEATDWLVVGTAAAVAVKPGALKTCVIVRDPPDAPPTPELTSCACTGAAYIAAPIMAAPPTTAVVLMAVGNVITKPAENNRLPSRPLAALPTRPNERLLYFVGFCMVINLQMLRKHQKKLVETCSLY